MEKTNFGKRIALFWAVVFACALLFGSVRVSAAAKTVNLAQNKWHNSKSESYRDAYHKIKIPKTGYITLEGWEYYSLIRNINGLKIQICNSKKKDLLLYDMWVTSYTDGETKYRSYTALKKGTYYIHIKDVGNYKLKYSFKSVSDKSGASKAKAKAIAKNKTANGLFLLGENKNKTDWYKIQVPFARTVTFAFGAKANRYIDFKILDEKGAYVRALSLKDSAKSENARLKKGTYYIQVRRYEKDTAGLYTLKWK